LARSATASTPGRVSSRDRLIVTLRDLGLRAKLLECGMTGLTQLPVPAVAFLTQASIVDRVMVGPSHLPLLCHAQADNFIDRRLGNGATLVQIESVATIGRTAYAVIC
jgi:hypothetical protein